MENLIVVPGKMSNGVRAMYIDRIPKDELKGYTQFDLVYGRLENRGLTYAEALDRLDLWHEVNVWSLDPVVLPIDGVTQQEVIDKVADVIRYETQPDFDNLTVEYDSEMIAWMRDGVPDWFAERMLAMRDEYRLDRAARRRQ